MGRRDNRKEMPVVRAQTIKGEQEIRDAVRKHHAAQALGANEPDAVEQAHNGPQCPFRAVLRREESSSEKK